MKWWENLKQHRVKFAAVVTLLVLLIGGVIAVAGAAGLAWTSTEKFCIGCHEMRENVYKEFKGTVHDRNAFGVRAICSNCHVPHDVGPLLLRKARATFEIWGHLTGVIDTREKFEKHRYELAKRVWTRMVTTDSLECRNCHVREAMVMSKQSEKAQSRHKKADAEGITCIECHFGIAHTEPEGELGPTEIKEALKKAGKM